MKSRYKYALANKTGELTHSFKFYKIMDILVDGNIIKKDIRNVKIRSKNGATISFMENPEGDLILTNR